MQKRTMLFALVALATGCKKDESPDATKTTSTTTTTTTKPGSGAATGTAPGTATAVSSRPSQGHLDTMPALQLPDDPKRKEKVELGHDLFFDTRLSADGKMACVSCHQNADGNGGHDPTAIGDGGKPIPRHAPVIWNVGYWKNDLAWDGHVKTLEDQVKGATGGAPLGVGDDKLEAKAAELYKIPGYKALFDAAFPGQPASFSEIQSAIAEYERTLTCTDTAYDKFAGGDKTAMTDQQQRGLDVFMGKGMCNTCHTAPYFSIAMMVDGGQYFDVGVGTQGKPDDQIDTGRMKVTNDPKDWAAFKPPSLRNVTKSAPYFHDGSAATLDDALKVMAGGGIPNKNLTQIQAPRNLTADETSDLKSFLGALECPEKLEQPKLP